MSQEGVSPPQEVHGGSAPAGAESAKTVGSNSSSSSVVKPASENNNAESKPASTAVVHAGENSNVGSKPASPAVLQAGENTNAGSKPASPAAVDAGESNVRQVKDEITGEVGGGDDAAAGGVLSNSSKPTRSSVDGGSVHDVVKDAPTAAVNGGGSGSGKGKGAAAAESEHALHIWTERERRKKMKNMFSTLHTLLPRLPDKADKATIVGEAVSYIKTLEGTLQKLEKMKLERKREQALQQQLGAGSSLAPASSSARRAAPAPAPATREATLADMVHGWNAQQAAAAAAAAGAGSSAAVLRPVAPPPPAPAFQTWSGPNVAVSMAGDDAFINLCTRRQRGTMTKVLCVLEKHSIDVLTTNISADRNRSMFAIHARIRAASAPSLENLTAEDRYKLAVSEMLQWIAK